MSATELIKQVAALPPQERTLFERHVDDGEADGGAAEKFFHLAKLLVGAEEG